MLIISRINQLVSCSFGCQKLGISRCLQIRMKVVVITIICSLFATPHLAGAYKTSNEASCKPQFDENFFGLNIVQPKFESEGTFSGDPLWDFAREILNSIATATKVTPSNYDALFSQAVGTTANQPQIVFQVVSAAGLCMKLPLQEDRIERTNLRNLYEKLWWYRSHFFSNFPPAGPYTALVGLSKSIASVRYPSPNSFFTPSCQNRIEEGKRFTVDDMLTNTKNFGFDVSSGSYYAQRSDRGYYFRRIVLTSDKRHVLSLLWVDDLIGVDEKLFEVCAFPLNLPAVTVSQ